MPPNLRSCHFRRYYDETILSAWAEGVSEFHTGRYWEAHERWEQGWVGLPSPDREILQAAIQVAGVLHLLDRRPSGALSLAHAALGKLERIGKQGGVRGIIPRIEIEGSEAYLRRLVAGAKDGREKLVARLIL